MAGWGPIFRAVPEEDLASVRTTRCLRVRLLATVAIVLLLLVGGVDALLGGPRDGTLAASVLLALVGEVAILLAARRSTPDDPVAAWLGPAAVLVAGVELALLGGLRPAWGVHHLVLLLSLVPLASVVAVWPPVVGFLAGAGAGGLAELLAWRLAGGAPHKPFLLAGIGLAMGLVAAASAQAVRLAIQLARRQEVRTLTERQLVELGRVTEVLAHELKNALAAGTYAQSQLSDLLKELEESIGHPQVTEDDLHEIVAEARAALLSGADALGWATSYLRDLREHARSTQATAPTRFRVRERVERLVAGVLEAQGDLGVAVSAEGIPPDLEIHGDPARFDQVVGALVSNAVEAIGESGVGSTVRVEAEAYREGARVRVIDDGPGIPEEMRHLIFQPMYSTRVRRKGAGLGLTLARQVAEQVFGGSLALLPGGEGATFEFVCASRFRALPQEGPGAWSNRRESAGG